MLWEQRREAEEVSRKQSPYCNATLATPVPGTVFSSRSRFLRTPIIEENWFEKNLRWRGLLNPSYFPVSKDYCQLSISAISEFHSYFRFIQLLSKLTIIASTPKFLWTCNIPLPILSNLQYFTSIMSEWIHYLKIIHAAPSLALSLCPYHIQTQNDSQEPRNETHIQF